MPDLATYASLAALQTAPTSQGGAVYLSEPGRAGHFVWRAGNFTAQIAADPRKGLYVPSSTSMPSIGCWVRDWDGTNGRPEWFGAVPDDPAADNVAALTACFALCPVTTLGPHDYYIHRTLTFDISGHAFVGVPGSGIARDIGVGAPARMGTPGASRVILTGPEVVSATVLQFGKAKVPRRDDETLTRNAELRDIAFCRDNGDRHRARNATSADATGCVKGIVCSGLSSAIVRNVASFDSPVGWHCHGCVYSKWDDCSAWRSTPARERTNDFSVGFLIGDYAANFGYAGANASVYFNRCVSYDLAGGSITIGLRLFGAIADTFLSQIEVGRCFIGIEIDGRDAAGRTIALGENRAQQNVHLLNPVIDATTQQGLQLRNLNASFHVTVTSPYIATAGASADISILGGADRVAGHVAIMGGVLLSEGGRGLIASDAEGVSVIGTLLRNYALPISLTNCRSCRIEPDVLNYLVHAAHAVHARNLQRSTVRPVVRGQGGSPGFSDGIFLEGGNHNSIDPTMVDFGYFTNRTAAFKVRYDGRDARGDKAFAAAGNVLVGVTD